MPYAEKTEVPADRSRGEIERTLERYGATSFAYGWDEGRAMIGFQVADRQIRIIVPLPDPKDQSFRFSESGRQRTQQAHKNAFDQEVRRRWRALALVIKAKLEAVETGIATFEQEFMAYVVLPSGQTLGEYLAPQLEETYRTGQMPALLPGLEQRALPGGGL